jgi:hypothetical protein
MYEYIKKLNFFVPLCVVKNYNYSLHSLLRFFNNVLRVFIARKWVFILY